MSIQPSRYTGEATPLEQKIQTKILYRFYESYFVKALISVFISFLGGLTMDVICTCALGSETNSIADPNNPLVVNARKVFDEFENPAMIPILRTLLR